MVERDNGDSDSELFVDTVTTKSEDDECAYAGIRLGSQDKEPTFKLDTGAQTSVIPVTDFAALMPGTPHIDCQTQAAWLWGASAQSERLLQP